MLFPNAHNGVKKIYTAEILSLIGNILLIGAAIFGIATGSFADTARAEAEAGTMAGLALGFIFLGLAGAVLTLIAFILNLVGITSAMKDEASFKTALIFTIIGIAAAVLSSIFSTNETVKNFVQILVNISELFVSLFVVQGIMNLATKLKDSNMVERGNKARWWLVITFCIPSVVKLVSGIFALQDNDIVASTLSLVSAVLIVAAYFIYLSYLARAKKMLEA